ncbi:MAG TPA: hypothetical protein VK944_10760 [Candidatus Limnocylindria bacterium]|nr:hypothetical protein [Candidatus Limnocylindria bacterium]
MSRAAKGRGFVDPVNLLSRLESFAQPLELKEPLEMLRAGMVFHARGLLNTSAIQHNMDWIWPFWVERQFDPKNDAFIPRAFSLTHVNLTNRNWTAVGIPDCDELPIVDPRGLLTPFWDSWSLDAWMASENGRRLIPSRLDCAEQHLELDEGLAVVTRFSLEGWILSFRVEVVESDGGPCCRMTVGARSDEDSWLVVALRPYNPEGVSFVHDIRGEPDVSGWRVGRRRAVLFDTPPDRCRFSDYRGADVHARLFEPDNRTGIHCKVGMATAAALFAVGKGRTREVRLSIPLERKPRPGAARPGRPDWREALAGHTSLQVPDPGFVYLYDTAVRSLVLHSPGEVYPGPYTYKRFWFRDAAFILHALLCVGLTDRVKRVLDRFPDRQTRSGFFLSQEGEWDSNGESLWIMRRYCELTGRMPDTGWQRPIARGGRWILKKRLSPEGGELHAGLLPPGFSAEHLGPNDYYYWDDFWGVAGLRAAAWLLEALGDADAAADFRREADGFLACIEESLSGVSRRLLRAGMPASPYRRMDSGSVGSLAAGYPLRIFPPRDPRLLDTAEYLLSSCLVNGGFFQDIIHSGINPYLTLHMAQVLLRAGDLRFRDLVRTTADLASPTGQWPEAVHVRTRGGCMGDGHHVWASAEWVLMIRNGFVREEGDRLVLGSGIFPEWLNQSEALAFGPAPTEFGPVSVRIVPKGTRAEVEWTGEWRDVPPHVEVRLPGFAIADADAGKRSVLLSREDPP